MQAVLGIDAAWTSAKPSGIALVTETGKGWKLAALESSYQRFHALADKEVVPELRPLGSLPSAVLLLETCVRLSGGPVSLVAIDMPLSYAPITGRRFADNEISRIYGRRGCSTHTPSDVRPGVISDRLREAFGQAGYPLRTDAIALPGLIEVYPHPALLELTGESYRLPYKASKLGKYWPGLAPHERRVRLHQEWRRIVTSLDAVIEGVSAALPELEAKATGLNLKAFEDKLDAIVCAWIAVCAIEGRAKSFGDDHAAIWVPRPNALAPMTT